MAQSKFDFDQYKNEHELTARFADLANLLERQPNLQPVIRDFKQKFKIPDEDPRPVFRFNLADRSFETIPTEVRAANRNLKKVTYVQGDRFFVARDFNEDPNTQIWEEVASASSVDLHAESSQLSFLDSEKRNVDWPQSLENLNRMIANKPYSEQMMKACLLRFVNHYESAQTEYLKDKGSNEIAQFLISLDAKFDRVAFHRSKLQQSCRAKGEPLSSAVMKIKNIVDKIYPLVPPAPQGAGGDNAPAPAQAPARAQIPDHHVTSVANRLLINAIVSFLADELAAPLLAKVQNDHASNRLLSYSEYLKLALGAEAQSQIFPTVALHYGRRLNTRIPIMGLNNLEVPLIHPSMSIPKRKGFYPYDLAHYFPAQSAEDDPNDNVPIVPLIPPRGNQQDVPPPYRPHLPVPPVLQAVLQPPGQPEHFAPDHRNLLVTRRNVPAGVQLQHDHHGVFFLLHNERVYVEEEPGYDNPNVPSDPPSVENITPVSGMSDDIYEDVANMSNMLGNLLKRVPGVNKPADTDFKAKAPFKTATNAQKPNPNSYRPNSRDRQDSTQNSRGRSADRNQSKPDFRNNRDSSQNRQNYRDSGPSRQYSRDRRDLSRDRPYSKDSSGNNNQNNNNSRDRPRDSSRNRQYDNRDSRNRSQSRDSFNRNNNYDRSRSRYPSNDRSYNDRRDISRDRSQEAKRFEYKNFATSKLYPKMKKGYNCSNNYNPMLKKSCSKCPNEASHHEFECSVYEKYNENRCTACDKYYHFSKDCRELTKFPPKHADSSSISNTPN